MGDMPPGIGKRQSLKGARITTGRIIAVDEVRYLVSVVDSFNRVYDGVRVAASYLNTDGGGSWVLPDVDTQVILSFLSTSTTPVVTGFLAGPKQLSEDDSEDPADNRQNRPVLSRGDQMVARTDSGFITARKDGTVEVGGSQIARRWYIPFQNLVRDMAENYEMLHTGGTIKWETRRSEDGDSPTEFQLNVRETVESEPVVSLSLGRILGEEGQKLVDGEIGAAVVKFFVNNRFRLWIDRDGNLQSTVFGTAFHCYSETRKEYNMKDVLQEVKGLLNRSIGNEETEYAGNKQQSIQGDKILGVGGSLIEFVEGNVDRRYGPLDEEIRGDAKRKVIGTERLDRTGGVEDNTALGRVIGTGGNKSEDIVKTSWERVRNADNESRADVRLIERGESYTHNTKGNLKLAAGGVVDREVASVDVRPSGAVVVTAFNGQVTFEVNKTGGRLKTPGGVIELDTTGSVALGPAAGLGRVVTTLTHPFDLVTGTPILGSTKVFAGGGPSAGPALGTAFRKDG